MLLLEALWVPELVSQQQEQERMLPELVSQRQEQEREQLLPEQRAPVALRKPGLVLAPELALERREEPDCWDRSQAVQGRGLVQELEAAWERRSR